MTDDLIMPWGKYKGEKLINVPGSYLLWCYDQEWCKGELKNYIEDNKDVLEQESKPKNQ